MAREVDRLRPRVVGLSCALPAPVPGADAVLVELDRRVTRSWQRRFILGGFAFRTGWDTFPGSSGARITVTLDEAERAIRGAPTRG